MTITDKILFFDGICNLCNGLVQFILKVDKRALISFSPLQSRIAKERLRLAGIDTSVVNSVVYLSMGNFFYKSGAILELLKDIGGIWKLFYIFRILPRVLRDGLYDLIATHRYSLFGRKEQCMVPAPEIMTRFIL